MRRKNIGKIALGSQVDVTDPCYDKDVWCRMNAVKIKPGNYDCNIWISKEKTWGERVGVIGVYLDGNVPSRRSMERIGSIGVDAGMAGFFHNKPDYDDEQWEALCDATCGDAKAWITSDGFFSESGFGDGEYNVYAQKNKDGDIVAIEIAFM